MNSRDGTPTSSRLPRIVLTCGVIAGLVLLVAGLFWSHVMPPQTFWSQEQAEEYEAAAVELHKQLHSHEGNHDEKQDQMHSARHRFEQAKQGLESARYVRDNGGRALALIGSLLLGGSALGLYFRRQNETT